MQVFELYFNPKTKEDVIFDTFYYEPEDIYERRLGYLFMAGKLSNVLPQNARFLKNLARVIKTKFYSLKTKSPQRALKESLKEANRFLEKIAKEGDVSWISNLNFAILNLTPKISSITKKIKKGKYTLSFTKVGDIKIFLARGGRALDIGQNLKFEEIEPYPLKVFLNIVSGKLEEGDKILVMTKGVSAKFLSQNVIEKMAVLPRLEKRGLSRILKDVKRDVSGFCLLISLEAPERAKQSQKLILKGKIPTFVALPALGANIRGVVGRFGEKIKKSFKRVKIPIPFYSRFGQTIAKIFQKIFKLFKIPSRIIASVKPFLKRENVILVLSLIFFLVLGGFLGRIEENRKTAQIQLQLRTIQEKIDTADALLILEQNKKANNLLLEALSQIQPLAKTKGPLASEISQTEENIKAKLFDLNKLEIVEAPKSIFKFEAGQFLPEKIICFNKRIYFLSPHSENVFELDEENKIHLLEVKSKFNGVVPLIDTILFFAKPNQLFPLREGKLDNPISLKSPFEGFEPECPCSFKSHLYFLDKKTGEIVKYEHIRGFEWKDPVLWLSKETKKATNAKSMAIDGRIWVLKEGNLIDKYYRGDFQETITVEIFPLPENFLKIWTSSTLPYLYILEPSKERIIILNKEGEIVKQYQSEKFNNLKDFAVSGDGKKIYLLNELELYQLDF